MSLQKNKQLSESDAFILIHELQVHKIELEMQNDELQRANVVADNAKRTYLELYDFAPSGYFTLSKLGNIIELNLKCSVMIGKERSKLKNSNFGFFVSTDTKSIFRLFLDKVFQSKIAQNCEVTLLKDGDLLANVLLTGIINKNEELCNVTMVDITERKQMENERLKAQRLYVEAERIGKVGSWHLDFATNELYWSEELYKMYGFDHTLPPPILSESNTLFTPESWELLSTSIARTRGTGIPYEIELKSTEKDGSNGWMWALGEAVLDKNGNIVGLRGTAQDITQRKQVEEQNIVLEQQLQHGQRLESLGVLSGGIAHDFNNILAIIMGYCDLIMRNYATAEKNIPKIEKAAERAAALCGKMMAYAGKAKLNISKVNMVTEVDEVVGMLRATLPSNTAIKTEFSAKVPIIEGDVSQLNQIVMNLIINASEAIGEEQGEVNVSLAKTQIESGKSCEDCHGKPIPPGDYVCLQVTDNGYGMDEATKKRIFEPFYTTKFTGRGLGLSAVLGIIKTHSGALQLFSQPGRGTTFKVFLPALANDTARKKEQTASAPAAPWQGSGTILLVEDEEPLRGFVKGRLEELGFTVLEAGNGKEALDMYQSNTANIALVFTDIGMPVMDGYQLISELKKLNPELPIIVSSGFGETEVITRLGIKNIAGHISKPYNADKLREVLKRILERT
jgi:PAS domain S-box-containing protein